MKQKVKGLDNPNQPIDIYGKEIIHDDSSELIVLSVLNNYPVNLTYTSQNDNDTDITTISYTAPNTNYTSIYSENPNSVRNYGIIFHILKIEMGVVFLKIQIL